ncbi:hypothetical protein GCM10020258_14500 [Sphingomonas yabuuchiae]
MRRLAGFPPPNATRAKAVPPEILTLGPKPIMKPNMPGFMLAALANSVVMMGIAVAPGSIRTVRVTPLIVTGTKPSGAITRSVGGGAAAVRVASKSQAKRRIMISPGVVTTG